MSELDRLAAACLQPSFPGHAVPELGRALARAGAGRDHPLRLQRRRPGTACRADGRPSRRAARAPDLDRRGGRRRDAARGRARQLLPRQSCSRRRGRRRADRGGRRRDRGRAGRGGRQSESRPGRGRQHQSLEPRHRRAQLRRRPRARRASRRCVRHRHAAPGRGGLREALPRPRRHGCRLAPRAPGDRGRPRRRAAAVPRCDRGGDSGHDGGSSARARPRRRACEPQRADPIGAAARRARLRRSDRHRRARDGRRQLDLRPRGSSCPRPRRGGRLARARPRPARGGGRAGPRRDRRRRPHGPPR